ncbi:MAG: hypothetical protein ACI9HA_003770, partial [Dinoroseobacter sp.]
TAIEPKHKERKMRVLMAFMAAPVDETTFLQTPTWLTRTSIKWMIDYC